MVIQRTTGARVRVGSEVVGEIGTGLVVLAGMERGDTGEQVERAARRLAGLRVFEDPDGRMNLGLDEVAGEILLISQFTLAGSIARGRRPGFDRAMPAREAQPLVEDLERRLREGGVRVATGVFGAHMAVELVNDGPVTLLWEDRPETAVSE